MELGAAVEATEELGVAFSLNAEVIAAGFADDEGEVIEEGDVAFGDLALGFPEDREDAGAGGFAVEGEGVGGGGGKEGCEEEGEQDEPERGHGGVVLARG